MVLNASLAISLAGAMVLASIAPGCLWPSCDRGVAKDWVEPGLFDRFPAPGKKNGYEIWWEQPPVTVYARKLARVEETWDPHISVKEGDAVSWSFAHDGRDKNDAETGRLMNSTFDALGLSRPKALDWDFSWHQVC